MCRRKIEERKKSVNRTLSISLLYIYFLLCTVKMPKLATIFKEALTIEHLSASSALHALVVPVTAAVLGVRGRDLLVAPGAVWECLLVAIVADRKPGVLVELAERVELVPALLAFEALLVPLLPQGGHRNRRAGDGLPAQPAGRRRVGGHVQHTHSFLGADALVDARVRGLLLLDKARPAVAAELAPVLVLGSTVAAEHHLLLFLTFVVFFVFLKFE